MAVKAKKLSDPRSFCPDCAIKIVRKQDGSIPAHGKRTAEGTSFCDGGQLGFGFFRLWSKRNTKGEHE